MCVWATVVTALLRACFVGGNLCGWGDLAWPSLNLYLWRRFVREVQVGAQPNEYHTGQGSGAEAEPVWGFILSLLLFFFVFFFTIFVILVYLCRKYTYLRCLQRESIERSATALHRAREDQRGSCSTHECHVCLCRIASVAACDWWLVLLSALFAAQDTMLRRALWLLTSSLCFPSVAACVRVGQEPGDLRTYDIDNPFRVFFQRKTSFKP